MAAGWRAVALGMNEVLHYFIRLVALAAILPEAEDHVLCIFNSSSVSVLGTVVPTGQGPQESVVVVISSAIEGSRGNSSLSEHRKLELSNLLNILASFKPPVDEFSATFKFIVHI